MWKRIKGRGGGLKRKGRIDVTAVILRSNCPKKRNHVRRNTKNLLLPLWIVFVGILKI